MLNLGLFAFTQPWLLLALVALPALWLLLRVTPPAPRRQLFPALRLLLRLESREETPARTPWWLLLLRLVIAACLILALAGPLLNPAPRLAGSGPLLLVVDDGWSAAPDWERRIDQARAMLTQAEREERPVEILRTAPAPDGQIRFERIAATAALESLPGWQPRPWPTDPAQATQALADHAGGASAVWLSAGIAESPERVAAASRLAARLREIGPTTIIAEDPADLRPMILPPDLAADGLVIEAVRPAAGIAERREVRVLGPGSEVLGRAVVEFAAGARRATAGLDMPLDLRNRIARLELQPKLGIGDVALLDERWRRRAVGIVGQIHATADQPLLSEIYFIDRALSPYASVRTAAIADLVDEPLSMIALPDSGRLPDTDQTRLMDWMKQGGVLLRFAGPRLATAQDDPLVPVPLRAGDRQLGGVLSWSEPLSIGSFAADGPFAGLATREEAKVWRQVLAEPGPGLAEATLASLADGTPLVTARRVEEGWLVLVHTTANTAWTSLPLSGLFVDMLRRMLAMAPGSAGTLTGTLQADALLDAQGMLHEAPPGTAPMTAADFTEAVAGPQRPPGLYAPVGQVEARTEIARSALNLQSAVPDLQALDGATYGQPTERYTAGREVDLAPWLLLSALILALVDLVIGYLLRGLVPRFGAPAAAALAGLLIVSGAQAQTGDAAEQKSLAAATETRLAYVLTGMPQIDEMSRAGLEGLGHVLGMRTSVETGEPAAVDIASDELAVYPILYWPVPAEHPALQPDTLERVEGYLRGGGMILFDTQDAGMMLPGQSGTGPGQIRLAELLHDMDLAPLTPVPADHVLTRSFYLLQEFPGRFTGQPVWVDQVPPSINDGVSSVIIGANDWAGAWAIDNLGRPLLPVVPGGESQRETARRFGVNLVMYALTGNYKTDQVHVPALLERLGQ